mgnify:CR=1 FL=1
MLFPIFYGFIAPDIASTKPLGAMNAALGLSTKLEAQISVAIGALQISVANVLSAPNVDALVSAENRRSADSAMAARERIVDIARNSGVTVHTEILKSDFSRIKGRFAIRARVHGLIFAEAGIPGEFLGGALIESLLFESGRPVIIVPNGISSEISLDHILIAWDGSINSARAVWDSIPLLRMARSIEIVTVTGEKELNDVSAGNTLAPMLSYLGKKVSVTVLTYDGSTAGGLIKQHATQVGAGLVVQGAYGRSRWSELILGGVTREMLLDCTLPILMSH